jgi:hypothetical protein
MATHAYIMIEANISTLYSDNLRVLFEASHRRLITLAMMETDRIRMHGIDVDFSSFIEKLKLMQRYTCLVLEVSKGVSCLKRLCIKYRDIDRWYIGQLVKKGICWKYIACLLKVFDEIMNNELSWPFKSFETFGDVDFCEVFSSRLRLLVFSS